MNTAPGEVEMQLIVKLEVIDGSQVVERNEIWRSEDVGASISPGHLGLFLAEGKAICAGIQRAVVKHQVACLAATELFCRQCRAPRWVKDHRRRLIDTVYSQIDVYVPRRFCVACGSKRAAFMLPISGRSSTEYEPVRQAGGPSARSGGRRRPQCVPAPHWRSEPSNRSPPHSRRNPLAGGRCRADRDAAESGAGGDDGGPGYRLCAGNLGNRRSPARDFDRQHCPWEPTAQHLHRRCCRRGLLAGSYERAATGCRLPVRPHRRDGLHRRRQQLAQLGPACAEAEVPADPGLLGWTASAPDIAVP